MPLLSFSIGLVGDGALDLATLLPCRGEKALLWNSDE